MPPESELLTATADALRIEPVRWLVPNHIPSGMLTVLAGEGGQGKSCLTLHLAAALTRGLPALGLTYPAPDGDALICSCEDDPARTVAPRLLAAGADLRRVHLGAHLSGDRPRTFTLDRVPELERALTRLPAVRLLVIDPVTAFVGGSGVNDHKDSDVRSLLAPLADLAQRRRLAVILVLHLNKAPAARAVHRILGSVGYVNAARAAFVVGRDPACKERRVLAPVKTNLAEAPPSLLFTLEPSPEPEATDILSHHGAHLADDERRDLRAQLVRVAWHGTTPLSADEALAHAGSTPRKPTRVESCANWLREQLQDGPRQSAHLEIIAIPAGFNHENLVDARQLLKAEGLQVSKRVEGWWVGFGDPARWSSPR